MKRITTFLMLLLAVIGVRAQSVTVASFELDEADPTANLHATTVLDANNEKCALIKIETTKTGFNFYVGSEGVRDTKQKVGQIWVYVPHGVKHISINHSKYAPCYYNFQIPIEKARTYVMKIDVEEEMKTQMLKINYSPANAIILIDGELVETTGGNHSMEILQGEHSYNAVYPGHLSQSGTFVLNGKYPYTLQIDLQENNKFISALNKYKPIHPLDASMESSSEESIALEPKTFTVGDISFNMLPVQGGTFMMGATSEQEGAEDNELPTHQVTLYDYFIGETEVTQALWQTVMGENPVPQDSQMFGADRPVVMVSWEMCKLFCERLNEATTSLNGQRFVLPTEAEWEYAARGGNQSATTMYSGSGALYEVGWGFDNSSTRTHEVAKKQANELGIYDMSGNVAEWCSDWNGSYSEIPAIVPEGPQSGTRRIIRGGSWNSYSDSECRVSARNSSIPSATKDNIGLRLVLRSN